MFNCGTASVALSQVMGGSKATLAVALAVPWIRIVTPAGAGDTRLGRWKARAAREISSPCSEVGISMTGRRGSSPASHQKIRPGTVRRILPYAKPYRWMLGLLLTVTALDAIGSVATPILIGLIIDKGIQPGDLSVVVWLSLAMAGVALVDALAMYLQAWSSARIGQG